MVLLYIYIYFFIINIIYIYTIYMCVCVVVCLCGNVIYYAFSIVYIMYINYSHIYIYMKNLFTKNKITPIFLNSQKSSFRVFIVFYCAS